MNYFKNNSATEGGALMRLLNNFTDDGTSIFVNNKASYGNNIASYPKYVNVSKIIVSN